MRNDPRSIMIFAAGFGARMKPLTLSRPKPLVRVGGKALLDRALDLADAAEIPNRWVNTHYLANQIETHLTDRPQVEVFTEHPDILDTGGGLKAVLADKQDTAVFTLNPDAVWTGKNPLIALKSAWRPGDMDALVMVMPWQAATQRKGKGDFDLDQNGRIQRGTGVIYCGAQIVSADLVRAVPDDVFSLNLAWDQAIRKGRAFAIQHDGGWCDVGTPDGIKAAETMLDVADG